MTYCDPLKQRREVNSQKAVICRGSNQARAEHSELKEPVLDHIRPARAKRGTSNPRIISSRATPFGDCRGGGDGSFEAKIRAD